MSATTTAAATNAAATGSRVTGTGVTGTGATLWLTGLPSAGKTTLARALAERLRRSGRPVEVLDGDEVRAQLSPTLGFTRAERDAHVQRIGWVAQLLARNGVLAIVPVIAPYAATRDAVRALHEAADAAYLEVHVATSVDVCADRDVKGLYAAQRAGTITGLTGVDDPYEAPESPDLRIDTAQRSIDDTVAALHALLEREGLA